MSPNDTCNFVVESCPQCEGVGFYQDIKGDVVIGHTGCDVCEQTGKVLKWPDGHMEPKLDETPNLTPQQWKEFHEHNEAEARREEIACSLGLGVQD